jgi:CRISPR-associated endonuclease Csn1
MSKTATENYPSKFILGLDLGPNSIGWAIIRTDTPDEQSPMGIVRTGVRIFQEAVDAKTRTPKNQARRDARGARRLLARYRMRRDLLVKICVSAALLPADEAKRNELLKDLNNYDPYDLRKKGLDNELTPYEFGRVLYHLNQRRGFKSNRKGKKDAESGEIKESIKNLKAAFESKGLRTLGEYLATVDHRRNRFPHHDRYTERSMYEHEFNLLWRKQAECNPGQYTPALRAAIFKAIFFQRPLKIQKHLVGLCTLESTRKRAAWAREATQRFRYLQDVNNLQLRDPITRSFRPLLADERAKLIAALESNDISWDKARKLLGLHAGEKFNLEESKSKGLRGNRTAKALTKAIGNRWGQFTDEQKYNLLTDLLTIGDSDALQRRLSSHWHFEQLEVDALMTAELEQGYARLSEKAIKKLLPFLTTGQRYDEAVLQAGYNFSAKQATENLVTVLPPPSQLRNPVVQRALFEVRRVVNAITKKYGKPMSIRVEMARDLKMGPRQLAEHNSEQRQREKENDIGLSILRQEFNFPNPSRADLEKYKLWNEMGKICPYSGRTISADMLFSPEVEVEHIIPFSRCLDDSFMNKTVSLTAMNRQKGDLTPHEMFVSRPAEYLQLLKRIEDLPPAKRARFEQQSIAIDDFIARQLNDTRYICTEVKKYLEVLAVPVQVTRGQLTAMLRRAWGLNDLLGSAPDGKSKVRDDHRHHAVDATVIALTTPKMLRVVATCTSRFDGGASRLRLTLPEPWAGFRQSVQKSIKEIIVSHAATRKLTDALHEATAYGPTTESNCFVTTKTLGPNITANQIDSIRDPVIKSLVKARFESANHKSKIAFGDPLTPVLHKDGKTPIRKVRILTTMSRDGLLAVKDNTGKPYKFFPLGNNHHAMIIKTKSGKYEAQFVTMIEAARRARQMKQKIAPTPEGIEPGNAFTLCRNDIVYYHSENQETRLYRVQKMSKGTNTFEITLRDIYAASTQSGDKTQEIRLTSAKYLSRLKKVSIDILGASSVNND